MKQRLILFIFIQTYCLTIYAQQPFLITQLDSTNTPKAIRYEGTINTAVSWLDSLGKNFIIVSETGIISSKITPDWISAELYAYHFIITNTDSIKQTWKVFDFIKDCPLDIEANFIKNTFQITDLNNNGIAEIWLMYKTICHSNASPCDMKIIMYEDQKKHVIKGKSKIKITDTIYEGGEYLIDEAFSNGPVSFKYYAKALWDKNVLQSFE